MKIGKTIRQLLQHFQLLSHKRRDPKVKPKRKSKWKPRNPQNHQNLGKRAHPSTPPKNKKRYHEKLVLVLMWGPRMEHDFAAFWRHFWALGHPGTNMVPKSPLRAPGMASDPTFCEFGMVWGFIFNGIWHQKIQKIHCKTACFLP